MENRRGWKSRKLQPKDIPNETWSDAKHGDLVVYEDGYVGLEGGWSAPNRIKDGRIVVVWSGDR